MTDPDYPKALIATSVIHRVIEPGTAGNLKLGVAPIAPKVEKLKPGTLFTPKDYKEYQELKAAGAFRIPENGESVGNISRLNSAFPIEPSPEEAERMEREELERARRRVAEESIKAAARERAEREARLQAEAKAKEEAEAKAKEEAEAKAKEAARLQAEADAEAKAKAKAKSAAKKAAEDDSDPV